ncbi:MAG: NINE protein [Sarcina sp.]
MIKNRFVLLIVCIFFGIVGAHRFLSNKIGTGILYLFTGGLFGIGWLCDIVTIATGKYTVDGGRITISDYERKDYYREVESDGTKFKRAFFLAVCILFGVLGIHRFLAKKPVSGVLYLFTGGLFGIGWIWDIISIATGRFPISGKKVLVQNNLRQQGQDYYEKEKKYEKEKYEEILNSYKVEKVEEIEIEEDEDEGRFIEKDEDEIGDYTSNGFVYYKNDIDLTSKIREIKDFVILSFEGTGKNPDSDKIIELSIFRYRDNKKVNEFISLVNPEIDLPMSVKEYSPIKDEDLKYAESITEIMDGIIKFIGDDIIAVYNPKVDLKFLRAAARKLSMDCGDLEYINASKLAMVNFKNLENYEITTVKEKLNVIGDNYRAETNCYVISEILESFKK